MATDPPADAPHAPQPRPNRLINENSPYLLQHAHNPVDWRPWGPEAFEEARARNAPIFLSIGYSTCYWCHVMERESFENHAIAHTLNERFVPIKVDREQRPDVDQIYMQAVQALTGAGGWPLSVFLTPPGARGDDDPGLEPFWGGTYFPVHDHPTIPTFPRVLDAMHTAWTDRREDILTQAATVTDAVRAALGARTDPVRIGPPHVAAAADALLRIHDAASGGFGRAPKFPQPLILEFFLTARPHTGDDATRAQVDKAMRRTLDAMATGGVYDHVAGGFHRYSVDTHWRVPHFEKMLYDNALLAGAYARAARAYDDPFYARVARRTCDYVLREMTGPDALFYSAQDAEADAREGRNYLWTADSMAQALDADDLAFALDVFNINAGPNFQDPHHPGEPPANVLYLADRPDKLAKARGVATQDFLDRLDRVAARLYDARAQRPQPITDDKAITAWNALMIRALADTAAALDEPRYLDAADRAARALLDTMRDERAALLRIARAGHAGGDAVFEDHAYLTAALVALHRAQRAAKRDSAWALEQAIRLAGQTRDRFADPDTGAYYDTATDQPHLLVRSRSADDGAMPSPSGVMLHTLLDLYELTGERAFRDHAGALLASLSREVAESPAGVINTTRALVRIMTTHPAMFEEHAFGVSAPTLEQRVDKEAPAEPVQIFSSADHVVVPPQGAGEIVLKLEIAQGFHVNAPDPGVPGLVGLKIEIANATGLQAVPDYPEPELYEGVAVNPNSQDRLMVYTGAIEIPVRIVRTGAFVAGEPRLEITYQVCTDTECLPGKVGTLDVTIEAP